MSVVPTLPVLTFGSLAQASEREIGGRCEGDKDAGHLTGRQRMTMPGAARCCRVCSDKASLTAFLQDMPLRWDPSSTESLGIAAMASLDSGLRNQGKSSQ